MDRRKLKMDNFFDKLIMETYIVGMRGRRATDNIGEAIWIFVPDDETAEQLSEWSRKNDYPSLVNCSAGWYRWDDRLEYFYKI